MAGQALTHVTGISALVAAERAGGLDLFPEGVKSAAEVVFWEWSTPRDSVGRSVGLATELHEAMRALSRAIVAGGRPRTGEIAPVVFVRPAHEESGYLREFPAELAAIYDGTTIQWR